MKKKVIIGVVSIVVIVIGVVLALYIKERRENMPELELVESIHIMEYSSISIEDLVLETENVVSMEITDVDSEGDYEISEDGQRVSLGGWLDGPYEITVEAVGKYGDIVEEEIEIWPYQEPAVLVE